MKRNYRGRLARALARARIVAALERSLESDIASWLARVGNAAAAAAKEGHAAQAEKIPHQMQGRLLRTFKARLKAIATTIVKHEFYGPDLGKSASELESKGWLEDFLAAALDWIDDYAAMRVFQIADTTREQIRTVIHEAVEQPIPPKETAAKIVERTGGDIGKARAIRIARTETHGASERATFEMMRKQNLPYDKEWVAVEDARTRLAHRLADGQTVATNEPFIVGGEAMMFCGDPSASPRNLVNCRCVTIYIPRIPK